jgi:hypothetical protein
MRCKVIQNKISKNKFTATELKCCVKIKAGSFEPAFKRLTKKIMVKQLLLLHLHLLLH